MEQHSSHEASTLIEPHAYLLKIPRKTKWLYKIVSVENLMRSISENYLHFNRVNNYKDFPGADSKDGEQLLKDRPGNRTSCFASNSEFTAEKYYDQSRARTYSCCFSLENSAYIWENYGNGSTLGKVCLVFNFPKLQAKLNETISKGLCSYIINNTEDIIPSPFHINYGVIKYIDWGNCQSNQKYLQNPIHYIYLKDKSFEKEKEFRISLSALGIGTFLSRNSYNIEFPANLKMDFEFKAASTEGIIEKILCIPNRCDLNVLTSELSKFGIIWKNKLSY